MAWMRQSWLEHRTPRKCEKCGREYLPEGPTQKFCSVDCYRAYHNKEVVKNVKVGSCRLCGRKSHDLDENNLCTFCHSAERKLTLELENEKAKKRYFCSICGTPISWMEKKRYFKKCVDCYFKTGEGDKAHE